MMSSIDDATHDEEHTFRISNTMESLSEDVSQILMEPLPMRSNVMSFLVGAFVAVGGFLFGYDTGLINSLTDMAYVKSHLAPNHHFFTNEQMSIVVSFLSLGTFFGALTAPVIADSYGRKATIMFSTAVIFSIGNSLQVASSGWKLLIIGRVVSGLGIGLISAVVPLYQAEAAKKNLRGAIISTYQCAITLGLLVSSAVSQGTQHINNPASYRIPIGLQYVWSSFLAIGMIFLPESPRYYVMKDDIDRAAKSLSFLRGVPIQDPRLLEELVEIKATYDYEASFGPSSIWDCFKSSENRPKQVLRMFTGIAIQTFQQFSGINFIFYYGVTFFSKTGVNKSYMVSLITYAVNVAFNIPGMFLVEYLGRRKILLFGGIVVTASNFVIAGVGCRMDSVVANKVMIAFICLFIASFSATWSGAVWVISAELYPLGVRSKCTAICAAANWLVNFICALITPYIVNSGSESTMGANIFFIWGSLNALGVVCVFFTVYETSGLTLEEIDELYRESANCFGSIAWNKKIRERPVNRPLFKFPSRTPSLTPSVTSNVNYAAKNEGISKTSSIENANNVETSCSTSSLDMLTPIDPTEVQNNYVDLGNGLELNAYNRGPPSFLTASSDDEEEDNNDEPYSGGRGSFSTKSKENKYMDNVNIYMAQLIDSASNTSASNTTDTSLHLRHLSSNVSTTSRFADVNEDLESHTDQHSTTLPIHLSTLSPDEGHTSETSSIDASSLNI